MRSSAADTTSVGIDPSPARRAPASYFDIAPSCFIDDRRLIGEVVAEERSQPRGERGPIGLLQVSSRHDQFEEGVAPHGARANSHAQRGGEHR